MKQSHRGRKGAGKLILVIDDDGRILRFTKMSLEMVGYAVIAASNGSEALKLAATARPDIVLLDLSLPVMDGFQVLSRLRAVSSVPVIAFSAHTSAAARALELGADRFLAKPFRPEELLDLIVTLLEKG
ncbi:MAG: response regulator [candidate division WOR-3 bacterium]